MIYSDPCDVDVATSDGHSLAPAYAVPVNTNHGRNIGGLQLQ